jgi:hypothetical protein|tara:strand:- start:3678 stop:4076 length:399 start_codon:yes stop_codon:yes gene_type:complete
MSHKLNYILATRIDPESEHLEEAIVIALKLQQARDFQHNRELLFPDKGETPNGKEYLYCITEIGQEFKDNLEQTEIPSDVIVKVRLLVNKDVTENERDTLPFLDLNITKTGKRTISIKSYTDKVEDKKNAGR